jgi:two-component system catabolic regulation response regulator CreB
VPKPFSPRELVARVRALLRRAALPRPAAPGFELDDAGQRIRYAGHALPLTRLEYGLLRTLLAARPHPLARGLAGPGGAARPKPPTAPWTPT